MGRRLTLLLLAICIPAFAGRQPDTADILDGFKILRCQVVEKRLVIRRGETISVLHEKEVFPGTRIEVRRIDRNEVLLEKKTTGKGRPASILIFLTPKGEGFSMKVIEQRTAAPDVLPLGPPRNPQTRARKEH